MKIIADILKGAIDEFFIVFFAFVTPFIISFIIDLIMKNIIIKIVRCICNFITGCTFSKRKAERIVDSLDLLSSVK